MRKTSSSSIKVSKSAKIPKRMSTMAEVINDQKRILEEQINEPGYESEEEQIQEAAVKT